MTKVVRTRGERSREHIYATALSLFRTRGFDRTTMRDVADKAGVALGGAYYYFRSKNDIVHAYYEQLGEEHSQRVRAVLEHETDLRRRLGAVFHTSVDMLKRDRKLIAGVFRDVGEVGAASPFAPGTKVFRERGIGIFAPASLGESQRIVATLLWGAHMAMVLYMVHDDSKGHERTRKLVDGALDSLVPLLPALPLLGPTLGDLSRVLRDAGLVS